MLARDNEQPRGPPRMPRRLLGESRELEAAAPPPRGPALPRQGRLLEATHAPARRLSPGPGPPALPNPEPALRTWPPLSGILPRRRLRRPLPIPSLPGPAPSSAGGSDWQMLQPIDASPSRPCHQFAPAGGGASPKSSQLLPGPQDPFCLGEPGWD